MARIRSIHPGIWTDESFMTLSLGAQVLFFGLLTESDDGGSFKWNPPTLKVRIFPARDVAISDLLRELVLADRIRQYDCEGKPWGVIRNFRKYQRPQKPGLSQAIPNELEDYAGGPARGGVKQTLDEVRLSATGEVSGRSRETKAAEDDGYGSPHDRKPDHIPTTLLPYGSGSSTPPEKERDIGEEREEEASPPAAAAPADRPRSPHLIFKEKAFPLLTEIVIREKGKEPTPAAVAKLLNDIRDHADRDEDVVLAVLRAAHALEQERPIGWMKRQIDMKLGRIGGGQPGQKPKLVVDNDPDDAQGIQGWCKAAGFEPTTHPDDIRNGKWIFNGKIIDRIAGQVAAAARLPHAWRGDWGPLLDWIRDGLDPTKHIIPAISSVAAKSDYEPPGSLRMFDGLVRSRKAA